MSRRAVLGIGVAYAFGVAAAVILLAGYYSGPELLVGQVAMIAGPTFAPVAVLVAFGRVRRAALLTVVGVTIAGWAYVTYVDSRPYQGGGASFAVLLGWFVSLIAIVIALVAGIVSRLGSKASGQERG